MQIIVILPNTNKETQHIEDRWYVMQASHYCHWFKDRPVQAIPTRFEDRRLQELCEVAGTNSHTLIKTRWATYRIGGLKDAKDLYDLLQNNPLNSVLE